MTDYEKWLSEELEKVEKKYESAFLNYQESGESKYYNQYTKLEYQHQTLMAAIKQIKIKDHLEMEKQRAVENYIKNLIQNIAFDKDADEIKEKIKHNLEWGW